MQRFVPFLLVLFVSVPVLAALAPYPILQDVQAVLVKHGLEPERLGEVGISIQRDGCHRLDGEGRLLDPALTPEQLDSWLSLIKRPERARPVSLGPAAAPLDLALGRASLPVGPAQDSTFVPAQAPAWRPSGLKKLAARFKPAPDSPTGLSQDAPEALRLLTLAIYEDKGGSKLYAELRRELSMVANLKPAQKEAFVKEISSPLIVYVALGRSHASHSLDSQLYFTRMEELLSASGKTVTDFIEGKDPHYRDAGEFLLRSSAYDALIPYLHRHPQEAGAIAPMLFPDGRHKDIESSAAHLEGLIVELASQGRWSPALDSYAAALLAIGQDSPDEKTARRAALYLRVNEELFPRKHRKAIDALAAKLPEDILEDSGLVPPDPREGLWPEEQWKFAVHFASTGSYKSWVAKFEARGYERVVVPGGVGVAKTFDGIKVVLEPKLYQSDEEGFLRGAEAQRFLAAVARDLRDPSYQGVILRNHAQFHLARLVDRKTSPGKLVLDGSCRSAWDLRSLRRKCPTCSFIVNTGTGYARVNNDAVSAVVEGLARGHDWADIHKEWARSSPNASARMQGPWTPPFAQAMKVLRTQEAAETVAPH